MQEWEYVRYSASDARPHILFSNGEERQPERNVMATLRRLGEEGWELVDGTWFKRPLS